MPMTMAEKLLAKAVGRASVKPGDVISPDPELVILHDGYVETAHRQLSQIGYKRITNPKRVVILTDHNVINTSPRAVEQSRANRRIAAEWQVGAFFDVGRGGHGRTDEKGTGEQDEGRQTRQRLLVSASGGWWHHPRRSRLTDRRSAGAWRPRPPRRRAAAGCAAPAWAPAGPPSRCRDRG